MAKKGWKNKKTPIIVGTETAPTKMESGQVIINKKATKQNLDKLIEINNDGLNAEKSKVSTDGTDGGILKGKPHYDSKGNSLGGIPVIVDGGKKIEVEGEEFVVNKEASQKHWKELSKINQSAGNGVPINPSDVGSDDDPQEFRKGGTAKIIFNPNHIPNKWIYSYAKKVKEEYPKVWDMGGNIFGNEAFKNLERVIKRGYWTDNEEWMYIKWQSYVARHHKDFRIAGTVAMLKWVDKTDKGWDYMKALIDKEIAKKYPKKGFKRKLSEGGGLGNKFQKNLDELLKEEGWIISYYDKNINDVPKEKAYQISLSKFDPYYENITIKLPSKLQVTIEWIMNKVNKDKIYKSFTENFNKILKSKGLENINAYPTSYGIGVFIFAGYQIPETKKIIENLLNSLGINYNTEYSDANYVFRYKISKSKENIEKIKQLESKLSKGGGVNESLQIINKTDEFGEKYDIIVNGIKQGSISKADKEYFAMSNSTRGGKSFSSKRFDNLDKAKKYIYSKTKTIFPLNSKSIMSKMGYGEGGGLKDITCKSCNWSWNKSDSEKHDEYVCHKCGADNKIEKPKDFMQWYIDWNKTINKKINISFSLPNIIQPFKESNVVILDLFEKIDQKIDAKQYLNKIIENADKYGVVIYLEPIPRYKYFLKNIEKRKKISKDYLISYYQKFGFQLTTNGRFMKRLPKPITDNKMEIGGITTDDNIKDVYNNVSKTYKEGGLIAPNGKTSNLTDEQYKLVRTLEFKAWFGDWENSPQTASKVVDENGEPLVVYHGSDNEFFVFNPDLTGYSSGAKRTRRGVYFSSKKNVAETFIHKNKKDNYGWSIKDGFIYEVFLNLRFPNIIDGQGKNILWWDRDLRDIEWNEVKFKDNAEKGFIIKNTIDTIGELVEYSDIYIAYNPSQIKLADGTNTTFDGNNPDIRYKDGGKTESHEDLESRIIKQQFGI